MNSDPQRARVYRWDRRFYTHAPLPTQQWLEAVWGRHLAGVRKWQAARQARELETKVRERQGALL